MSKQLYEEALADVKKVKEIAEDNAKRAIIEAVTPRIRDLIEKELMSEAEDDEEEILTDNQPVTLDLDAIASDPAGAPVDAPQFGNAKPTTDDEFEMNAESVGVVESLVDATHSDFDVKLSEATTTVTKFSGASRFLRESKGYQSHITQMIANVENMYEYVQGSVVDLEKKSAYESQLETLFSDLNKLQESAEMSKKNKQLNEEDVTLKLTGLPDEIDLESLGVDLITGEEDGEGEGDELALDTGDEEMGDDFGGEEEVDFDGMGDDEETQLEADLSDDTVVEIDENMLRAEIARMRQLREEKMSAEVLDDFGSGHDEGDQFVDGEVRTEGVEDDEEVVDENTDCEVPMEALQHKLALETKLIVRAKARAQKIKEAMATARSKKNLKLEGSLRKDLASAVSRINESSARITKVKGQIEAAKAESLNESRNNRVSKKPAEKATEDLRKKLAEANLYNVKLRYSNKLLQNESLSAKQKAQVISQLDEAKTEREAKLVYDSLTRTMSPKNLKEGSEGRQVLGSSSRTTRPASTQIVNEGATGGFDLDRWTKLAGIK